MAIPVATALGRRDRMWPAVALSVVAHAFIVAWGLARRPPPPIDLEQKPIIAKLVRLGEKRPEEWLPRKEAPPPPPAPAPPVAVPVAVAAPAKPAAPASEAKAPPTPKPAASLSSILSKVQREVEEQRYGAPDGDPLGDSESGSEGDRYLALVMRELHSRYNLSKTIPEKELLHLRATVILRIDASGRVMARVFERRSGNDAYDAALERAIAAARLPPPPPKLREHYATVGLGVNFHL